MDIDDFKRYNDFYGHPAGDQLLQKIGKLLQVYSEQLPICIGRIGGEEFMVIGENNSLVSGESIAEQIRKLIIELNVPHEKSQTASIVTISEGIFISSAEEVDKVDKTYELADKALYVAKEQGKNRWCKNQKQIA